MVFNELAIGQKFTATSGTPAGKFVKLKEFKGNCCNKPYNAAVLNDDMTREVKRVKLDVNLEVTTI